MMDAFREAFHIGSGTYYLPEADKVFGLIDQYDVATLQTYLKCCLYYKLFQVSFSSAEEPEGVIVALNMYLPSLFLKYQKKYLLQDVDCEEAMQILEQLRRAMSERIASLDWLSDATKMKAQEKLQAMLFNVGAPDALFNDDFKFTGQTHLEDFVQYKEQADDYLRNQWPESLAMNTDGKASYSVPSAQVSMPRTPSMFLTRISSSSCRPSSEKSSSQPTNPPYAMPQ